VSASSFRRYRVSNYQLAPNASLTNACFKTYFRRILSIEYDYTECLGTKVQYYQGTLPPFEIPGAATDLSLLGHVYCL